MEFEMNRNALSTKLGFLVFLLSSVSVVRADDHAGELAKIVNQLQSQVVALQESRSQDQATIRRLENKLINHFESPVTDFYDDASSASRSEETLEEPSGTTTTRSPIADVVIARVLTGGNVNLENPGDSERSELNVQLQEHSRAVRVLQHEAQSLDRLDKQLRELRDAITEVVKIKEREITATEDIAEFRLEADSLRDELQRVKREVEEVRAKRREEEMAVKRAKNEQVTTQWLQKTIEDLRREMTELASSVNISAALGQRQRDQASLELARNEIINLRKRLDVVHVAQERDSAWGVQMRQELAELRSKLQDLAVGHQRLAHEVAEMKEELTEKRESTVEERQAEKIEKELPSHHLKRHHGHWKVEIEELQNHVETLKRTQNALRYDIRNLKNDQEDANTKVDTLIKDNNDLVNRSSHLGVEQHAMFRQMEVIQHQMDQQERQSGELKSTVNNITEAGIKKLHASTVQLFKTLETLEDNYDKTMEDIRNEMSKMEFNLAQAQSTLSEVREEQTSYEHTLKSMRTEVKKAQMESKRDHYRLLSLRSDVLNKTLQESKLHHQDDVRQLKLADLESRISSLSKTVDGERQEVEVLHKQMAEKADTSDLSRWERSQDKLKEIVQNLNKVLPSMTKEEDRLKKEMETFVQQLPKDCASSVQPEQKSGPTLIRAPTGTAPYHTSPILVFCDMETSGGNWLVIQRRLNGRQNFNQNWIQYKEGFGEVSGDFWLGNELVHQLTTNGDYKLRIDFWDATGRYKFVEYDTFRVLQESDGYRLAIGGYSGNGSDALGYHNGMAFSTPDRDNDASMATHCGQFYGSGWWYNHCQYVNINGRYSTGVTWYDINGQEWSELTKVEMKIKPIIKRTTI